MSKHSPFSLPGETPSRGEKIKETVVLSILNVALPSVDVYSDAALAASFYIGSRHNPYCDEKFSLQRQLISSYEQLQTIRRDQINCYDDDNVPNSTVTVTHHYGWGTMMLLPFLLNYLICWYAWVTTDKRKAVSWIAALLSFYPQYVACKIIWQIWTDPRKGLLKKRQLERNLTQHETFNEAVFSTLIMTFLLVKALVDSSQMNAEGSEIILNNRDLKSTDSILFFVAFSTSVITSSLGLAKNLKVGPCRVLAEQKKHLGGLLSPRFILLFFACGLTLGGKGAALTLTFVTKIGNVQGAALVVSTIFLPGLLVGLFSCWHRGILKTFLAHPSVLLLPVFTNFTFVSNSKVCFGGRVEKKDESYLVFSPKFTAINVGVSLVGTLIHSVVQEYFLIIFFMVLLPSTIPGAITTLMFTFSNKCSCCKSSCCCSCCSKPFEFAALVTTSPHTPHILEEEDIEENMEELLENKVPLSSLTPIESSGEQKQERDMVELREEEEVGTFEIEESMNNYSVLEAN